MLWALMRARSPEQLAELRQQTWFVLPRWWLERGAVQVLGGLGVHQLLPAAHFPYWGVQSYGMLAGVHEPMVQEAMRRHLSAGACFIDVGSNVGVGSLLAARLVGERGTVLAVEPQRESAASTAASARLNGYRHVRVEPCAAGNEDGHAEIVVTADPLWTRLASVGRHDRETRRDTVAVARIDTLVGSHALERVDLVKIDVEGAELDVVAGMTETLGTFQPAVLAEMHGKNEQYVAAMARHGYEVQNLEGPTSVERAHGNVQTLATPRR